jgi:hypothetical protein
VARTVEDGGDHLGGHTRSGAGSPGRAFRQVGAGRKQLAGPEGPRVWW